MTQNKARLLVVLGASLLAGSCGGSPPQSKKAAATRKVPPMPDVYTVKLETSKGDIRVQVRKEWAPRAAARFYDLVQAGYYDGTRFHRVIRNFVAQFGIHPDPRQGQLYRDLRFPDEPVKQKNRRGTLSFAHNGPNTRAVQVFINLRDNTALDKSGFAPFGQIVAGMDVADRLYAAYGELAPRGSGPDGIKAELEGLAYLEAHFPRLDYIRKATVVEPLE